MPSNAPSPSVIAMRRCSRPPRALLPSGNEGGVGVRSAEIAGPSGLVRVGKYAGGGELGRDEPRPGPLSGRSGAPPADGPLSGRSDAPPADVVGGGVDSADCDS